MYKQAAYSTLYECLNKIALLIAPICPFISEEIYQNLVVRRKKSNFNSVHLADWPKSNLNLIDQSLSDRTNLAIKISSLGRSARSNANIKVRQPLKEIIVELSDKSETLLLPKINDQLLEELNVKNISVVDSESESLITYLIKPNLPKLGPKYGKEINKIKEGITKENPEKINKILKDKGEIKIGKYTLYNNEIIVETIPKKGLFVASDSNYKVGINPELDKDLISEGISREIIHSVQNLRKKSGLEISDRIKLWLISNEKITEFAKNNSEYIASETLSLEINFSKPINNSELKSDNLNIENQLIKIFIKKLD